MRLGVLRRSSKCDKLQVANAATGRTQQQQRPFNGLWSGTTRVGRYQKEISPTHTYPNQRASFIICFFIQSTHKTQLDCIESENTPTFTAEQQTFWFQLAWFFMNFHYPNIYHKINTHQNTLFHRMFCNSHTHEKTNHSTANCRSYFH